MDEKKFGTDLERNIDRQMRILRGRVAEGTLITKAFANLLKDAIEDKPLLIDACVQVEPVYRKDLRDALYETKCFSDSAYAAEKLKPFYAAKNKDKGPDTRMCFLAYFLRNLPLEKAVNRLRRSGFVVGDVNTFIGALNTGLYSHAHPYPHVIIAGDSVKYWQGEATVARQDVPVYTAGEQSTEIRALDWLEKEDGPDPMHKCYLVYKLF